MRDSEGIIQALQEQLEVKIAKGVRKRRVKKK
jgi:hypothetical protein